MVWVKRLSIAVGVLALLAGIGIAALFLFVDPNDYKATLEDEVRERYGRTLVIDGDIRLSLVPRLGLEISGVSLSEPQSNQVFAVIDTARAAVPWLPLLSRHLVVEHLTVTGLKANVVRDADGRFNFDDLIRQAPASEPGAPAQAGDPEQPSMQLAVAGINVSGGDIAYRDERANMAVRLERLAISASGITLGQPFDASVSARVLGQSPRLDANVQAQGRLLMNPSAGRYGVHGLDLRMTGMLPAVKANSFALRGDAGLDVGTGEVNLTGLSAAFQGDVALARPLTGVDAQLTVPRLALDLQDEMLQVDQVAAKATGRVDNAPFTATLEAPAITVTQQSASGGAVIGTFALEGPRAVDARLEFAGLSGNASQFSLGRASLRAEMREDARTTRLQLDSPVTVLPDESRVALPSLALELALEDSARAATLALDARGDAAIDWDAGTARAGLKGNLPGGAVQADVSAARLAEAVPALRFAVTAEHFDLTPWLEPASPGKPATARPAPAASKPVPTAPKAAAAPARPSAGNTAAAVSGGTAKPAPAEAVANGGDALFDYAALRRVDAHGTLRVAHLQTPRGEVRELAGTLALANGRAELRDVAARLFEGRLTGSAFADAGTQRLGLNAQFSDVAIASLLHAVAGYDDLSGKGAVKAEFTASGRTEAALRQSLNGRLGLQLRDGAYRGLNVAQTLRGFRDLIGRGEATAAESGAALSTDYAELRTSVHFADGVGTLRDLVMAAPLLRITEGSPATVDLPGERLDLMLRARVVNTSTGQDGKALERLRDVTIPIHVHGPLQAPTYTVMWNQVGSEALQRTLEREVGRQLDRLLERHRDEAPAPAEGERSSSSPTGKIIGEALKGLFSQ